MYAGENHTKQHLRSILRDLTSTMHPNWDYINFMSKGNIHQLIHDYIVVFNIMEASSKKWATKLAKITLTCALHG